MITIEEAKARKGQTVLYQAVPYLLDTREEGTITGTSSAYVFVLFRGDKHAKAVHPNHLDWPEPFLTEAPDWTRS